MVGSETRGRTAPLDSASRAWHGEAPQNMAKRRRAKRRSGAHERAREGFTELVDASVQEGYQVLGTQPDRVDLARGRERLTVRYLPGSASYQGEYWEVLTLGDRVRLWLRR